MSSAERDLSKLQLLSFEIGRDCNLAAAHPWCPINRPERKQKPTQAPMSDDQIVAFAQACVVNGFAGMIAFHYYNEPLLSLPRIRALAPRLPRPLVLWTNGKLIEGGQIIENGKITEIASWIDLFAKVYITDHDPKNRDFYQSLVLKYEGKVHLKPGGHDDRSQVYAQKRGPRAHPCYRPMVTELPIDHYGTAHLCCVDWDAKTGIGNIQTDPHEEVIAAFCRQANAAAVGQVYVCLQCQALKRCPIIPKAECRL